jgi:hypothetical protein
MNDELEGATITESSSGEVTHVARRQSTDAQRLGQRRDRCIDEVQADVLKRPSTSMARVSCPSVGGAYVKAPRARSCMNRCIPWRSSRAKQSTSATTASVVTFLTFS